MSVLDPLPRPEIGPEVAFDQKWYGYLTQLDRVAFAAQQSGVTANRPTKDRWAGRPYFDTTLGLPIWWNGTAWIKADGTPA